MALPFGILVAIYVTEFAPRGIKGTVNLVLDLLAGIPAIVVGIFVYGLIVVGHGQTGLAGSFALAVIMLPFVARSTVEVLGLVPNSMREAGLGLGAPRWRTTLGVVVPQAIGGILTGCGARGRARCGRDRAAPDPLIDRRSRASPGTRFTRCRVCRSRFSRPPSHRSRPTTPSRGPAPLS